MAYSEQFFAVLKTSGVLGGAVFEAAAGSCFAHIAGNRRIF